MPPVIELTHLSKTYAKRGSPPLQAVADLNLTIGLIVFGYAERLAKQRGAVGAVLVIG